MISEQECSAPVGEWLPGLLGQVNAGLESAAPEEVLRWAAEVFGERLTIGTSFGVSGMVLLDMARRVCPDVDIFYIDTGLFFPETYALIEETERWLGRPLRAVRPAQSVAAQAEVHGDALWSRDSDRCCQLRKVAPLEEALGGRAAWVTALRRDQAHTREATPVVSWNQRRGLVKLAPLARWTEREIWTWALKHEVPYNPLHNQGFPSIGCAPCTRAVQQGEDLRAGRWSGQAKTECGLHL
jgi:phosphoadenosine phosphosulfate reductase